MGGWEPTIRQRPPRRSNSALPGGYWWHPVDEGRRPRATSTASRLRAGVGGALPTASERLGPPGLGVAPADRVGGPSDPDLHHRSQHLRAVQLSAQGPRAALSGLVAGWCALGPRT